jgi:acyl-CoA thioester hydrolase
MTDSKQLAVRSDFRHFLTIATRWMDNDAYGHVNNVQYYSYFDTAVNQFLVKKGVLNIQSSPVIGLVVETQCRYSKSIVFPDIVHAGLRVAKLGNSSVRYELGLFREDDDDAAAEGHFIHVYVDRESNRPVPVPDDMRGVLSSILVS